ncbi:MAG: hypothetical protein U1E56_04065 [Bauldia sp.]
MGSKPTIVEGRRCGTCTLCCKVMTVEDLKKPAGQWCPHCVKGRGCAIYSDRPGDCRTFHCGYLLWPALGEHWLPARSKLVVRFKPDGMEIVVHVDPGVPNAWRAEPYHSELRILAGRAEGTVYTVFVQIGRRVIAVFPDRDVDLGVVAEDERVEIREEVGPGGRRRDAVKLKADDPRINRLRVS